MKLKLLPVAVSVVLFFSMAGAVLAAVEVPAPYAGMKNPFPWDDAAAKEAGKKLYQQTCSGCHGAQGDGMAAANFSKAEFSRNLEEKPDLYFWILSEGRLEKGMPPFKSSLSEERRWQVLTYLQSLSSPAAPPETPGGTETGSEQGVSLVINAPKEAQAGEQIVLTAALRDSQSKPVKDADVQFFLKEEFFASALMAIGEATTDDTGAASLKYTPRQSGTLEVLGRYKTIEFDTSINVLDPEKPLYHPEIGIPLIAPGKEVFVGPDSAFDGDPVMTNAPQSALRIPGGIISPLLILVFTVMLIWATYLRVMYQVFRVPVLKDIRGTNTRLIPLVGLTIVFLLGTFLVLKLLIGPFSHFHVMH